MLKNPIVAMFLIGGVILLIGLVLSVEEIIAAGAGVMVAETAIYFFYYIPRVRRKGY